MSKVITFSRTFPSYHPRAGEPTYFVEKIWNSLWRSGIQINYKLLCDLNPGIDVWDFWYSIDKSIEAEKHHTIRAGHHFKAGDIFSPRVWSGKPRRSKQIIIAHDLVIPKTWNFDKDLLSGELRFQGEAIDTTQLSIISTNDGLTETDLLDWFNKPFTGQIICWNDEINY